MIFFGYLKNNLNINLLNRFDDQPGGAVFDLVIMSILNMQEKKIAYIFAWKDKISIFLFLIKKNNKRKKQKIVL